MSMLARRAFQRALPRSRGFATTSGVTSYEEKQAALRAHAAQTADMWRKISFYVCFPGIIVTALWVRNLEAEHAEHTHHLIEENGGKLPQPPQYEFLNRRAKPFPWGQNSLFFNPKVQKDLTEEE
ncbi:mitochondrial cytochrome c oxidase subunit VIa [Panus rudis PR-1116 ss-1]|nr:mitochondrial cytochrome c oxidase subunit VIa [Panus rudis PR-1116 ss-1]